MGTKPDQINVALNQTNQVDIKTNQPTWHQTRQLDTHYATSLHLTKLTSMTLNQTRQLDTVEISQLAL